MLSSLLLVQQAAVGNCLSFDPFPFDLVAGHRAFSVASLARGGDPDASPVVPVVNQI
jgi:hypothetical protein